MKKIMILITTISIIFIIGCTPKVIEYVEYEGLKFELNNDGNYTVVGYLDEHQEHYVIPSKVKGKEVTIIGNNAFKDNSNIISIVFPNTIVSINQGAFYHCTSLLGVIIPESVQLIGIGAFSGCSAITNVIVLGETKIEWSAFFNCTALVNVVIPYVTHIGGGSFKKTPSLKHINIPSAKTIQREAFRYSGLEMAVIGGNVKNIGDHVFYDCVNLKSVILEEGVETLGQGAFFGCNLLDSINLPNSITSIGGGAFRYTSITNLLLGQNVEFINVFTFLNDKLLNIDVDENNNYYSSFDGVLFNKDKTTLIRYPKARTEENYVIPDGVIKIGENAFSDTLLKSIIVPESVIEIERHILIGSTITHIYFRLSYNHGLYKSWDSNWRFNYENQPYSIWNYKD